MYRMKTAPWFCWVLITPDRGQPLPRSYSPLARRAHSEEPLRRYCLNSACLRSMCEWHWGSDSTLLHKLSSVYVDYYPSAGSLVPRPSMPPIFDHLQYTYILQLIKNWNCRRHGNEAICLVQSVYDIKHEVLLPLCHIEHRVTVLSRDPMWLGNTHLNYSNTFQGCIGFNLLFWNTVTYSVFPSSCNIRSQEWEPCHPIKLLKDLNSALWMAHTVDAVATGSCKNLEKRCSTMVEGWGILCLLVLVCQSTGLPALEERRCAAY